MASITVVDGIDPSSLRLFLAVVDLGSLSKAATRHGLAQPSATSRIQKLERQLGVQLLDRSPTGSVATAAGVRLAPAVGEVLDAIVAMVDRADELRQEQTRLVIAATRHVAEHLLTGWIAAAELDDVRLDLAEADTFTVAQLVRSGEAVLGFTDGPAAPIGLRSELVVEEEVVPVVGRSHRWYGRRRRVTGQDLTATTVVLEERGSGTLDVVERALADHDLGAVGERIEVAGPAAAELAAVGGAGVAFLPRRQVEDALAIGDLHEVGVRDVTITQPIRVVWRGASPSGRTARRIVASLRDRRVHPG
jgi:DNA-binding transcriptional LysR family regulator